MINIKEILNSKEEFYILAKENLKAIKKNEMLDLKIDFVQKSLSILIEHEFIQTPCVKVSLVLLDNVTNQKIGKYYLYLTESKSFVDEFLVT